MQLFESNIFEVSEKNHEKGAGLFAKQKIVVGESIYRFDYWSRRQMPIHLTNHSCEPSASFNSEGMLVALRAIEKGEEITYDYLVHPIPAAPWNFKCACDAHNCVGWIDATRMTSQE